LSADIPQTKIDRGVLDLLLKQMSSGHWWLLPLAFLLLYLVNQSVHSIIMWLWLTVLIIYLALSDYFVLRKYRKEKKSNPDISTNKWWFQSVVIHNFILGTIVGVLPIICYNDPNLTTIIVLIVMACGLIVGGSAVLSAYLTAYFAWSVPITIGIIIFIGYLDLPQLELLPVFPILTVITGVVFALNARQLIHSSIETNLKNEILVVRAEQAAKDKSRFFASASHDLRQPLHALGLFIDTLDRNLKDELDRKLVKNISQVTEDLQILFDALLDISRLDAGVVEIKKEHFIAKDILKKMKTEFKSIAKEKGIQLKIIESNSVIYSDKVLSERIIRNLIDNAIKYTSSGSVTISTKETAESINVEVVDSGIGISDEELNNIFNEFYQINNPERDRNKGLGLGLSIVKRLIDILSLKLNIERVEPHGTKFIISFPTGDINKIKEYTDQNITTENKFDNLCVLVIDDEIQILEGMDTMLSNWGFDVLLADSIESAIVQMKGNETPDFILSDYRLRNNTTGIEAMHKIREISDKEIPALLLSGDTDPEKSKESQTAGLKLLHKPVKPAQLRTAIHKILNKNI
jgi:two-component system, sensor histidine kinase